MDITSKWIDDKSKEPKIIKLNEYTVNNVNYVVDGHHVILDPSKDELYVANVLYDKYNKKVELVPKVLVPQHVQTPDYLINDVKYDLKSLTGKGKNVLYDAVKKKKAQANNFVLDLSNSPLSDEEVERQIKMIYSSSHTGFVKIIVLVKNGSVVKVYDKN